MNKSKTPQDVVEIEQAKRNAAVAKARVQTTAGALKERLSPGNLAASAKERVREKTDAIGTAAQRRPVATGAAAGVATLIVFRKPVTRLVKRLFGRSDRRPEREERKRLKREAKAAKRNGRAAEQAAENGVAAPPDDLIPHAAVTTDTAAPVRQE